MPMTLAVAMLRISTDVCRTLSRTLFLRRRVSIDVGPKGKKFAPYLSTRRLWLSG